MAEKDKVHVTVNDKPLSEDAEKRVQQSLKKTLQEEIAREGKTVGGTATPLVSGHAKWSVEKEREK